MMRLTNTAVGNQAQPQQQPLPEAAPLTRANVQGNYNQSPVFNRGSHSAAAVPSAPVTGTTNRQGRLEEFDEVNNEVVEYGTECPPHATGKFPYIMDCRQYLNCWKGRGYIQSCAPGTMFNSETSECDFPSKVKCGSLNEPAASAQRLESQHVYRVPKKQKQVSAGAAPVESRSGFGDPTQAQTPEVKCPRRHSGLVEHPIYCDKFLNCANGVTYIQDCGPGTVFNPLHKVCDWPHNVDCGQRVLYADAQNGDQGNYQGQGQGNTNNGYENQQGQGSNQYENSREGRYHGGEGLLDVRMDVNVHQPQTPRTQPNGHHYPIYNRQGQTTQRNPYAVELPQQNLQPPPVPTTEIPRRAFGGQPNYPVDQQATASHWQIPWQNQGQKPVTTTPVPILQEPQFQPNYNRQYYNQQSSVPLAQMPQQQPQPAQQPEVEDPYENQELPMSQALLMLMKPYLANGNANPSNSSQSSSQMNWSSLMAQMATTTELPKVQTEFVVATEQDNMNGGVWTPENNVNNGSDEAVRPTTPVPRVPPGHSADWHRRHPEVPMHPPHHHGPHSHHRPPHHNHHQGGHSEDWHRRHPHIPMPGRPVSNQPNPANDPIVVSLDERVGPLDNYQCAGKFNCNNTKCIDQDQVCDGKNDCGNRLDESNCEHIGYQVRLSNELGTNHEGRIEVKVYDQWGYVCDDKFGIRDADVLCKELGFPLGASEVRANSFYPPHSKMQRDDHTVFLMDELDCKGTEKSLSECEFNGWGVHDCNGEEVVGVVCKLPVMTCPLDYWLCDTSQECIPTGFLCDGVKDCADHSDEDEKHCNAPVETRLVNGKNSLEGRVEIKYRGIWGTVCDDDFTNREAQVVCNGLGFHGQARVVKQKFGGGIGNIWLDQVNCIGNETSLEQCSHWQWGEHNCGHAEDVGVQCTAGAPPVRTTTPRYARSNDEPIMYHNFDQLSRLPGKAVEKASLMQADQCGRVQVRPPRANRQSNVFKVINGGDTQHGRHPWQAALRVRGQGKSSHWCGAVLISRFHVLTAAHCLVGFPKGAYFIRFGDHNTEVDERTETEIFIENLYIHDDFRKDAHMNNDIALIVLKAPVRFSDYIQPVCLPHRNAMYFSGMNCTISGWGSIQSGTSSKYWVDIFGGGVRARE